MTLLNPKPYHKFNAKVTQICPECKKPFIIEDRRAIGKRKYCKECGEKRRTKSTRNSTKKWNQRRKRKIKP